MNTLNENQANKLEGLLTLSEISFTLKSMKSEKSPGLSGFSAEFFKVFWKKLGKEMTLTFDTHISSLNPSV